ncbi:hypothetical protein BGZ72_006110 [Mortierella alpina]|nr:hypothetical protein BGZ72_006110 [Mortierella alpina]
MAWSDSELDHFIFGSPLAEELDGLGDGSIFLAQAAESTDSLFSLTSSFNLVPSTPGSQTAIPELFQLQRAPAPLPTTPELTLLESDQPDESVRLVTDTPFHLLINQL